MDLVFATNNSHKLAEIRRIVGKEINILSLNDINCHDEIPETGITLAENALQKAQWVKEKYGYNCFADDTGLMVDALNGAPGVYSARYAGPQCDAQDNMDLLLHNLENVSEDKRTAAFHTVIALLIDGETHLFEGKVEGRIDSQRNGNGGFGYDPIFIPNETGISFALMSADDKNKISHRGSATRKLIDFLTRYSNQDND